MIRELAGQVLGVLVRRGADFAAAEDAVQDALVEAVRRWGNGIVHDDGPAGAGGPGRPADTGGSGGARRGLSGIDPVAATRDDGDAESDAKSDAEPGGAPGRPDPEGPPADLKAWLVTVAWRKFLDARRSASARALREVKVGLEPPSGPAEQADDTLLILSRCCHPALTPASAIALTLRAVGGLTTAQIARAFLVPEATMAQRISRAKRTVAGERFGTPGDVTAVLRVLYLMFNEGFTGGGRAGGAGAARGEGTATTGSLSEASTAGGMPAGALPARAEPSSAPGVDLAVEAIRLARQLAAVVPDDPEAAGLLALMLLHHARRAARFDAAGELVPLDRQDRSLWDTAMIAEGVGILQRALARDQLGEYQVQAAVAALHDDAATAAETDWPQILTWYDELLALAPRNPVAELNRAIAVGHVDGAHAGLRALGALDAGLPRYDAAAAYLRELAGERAEAARRYAAAAEAADSAAERTHLLKQAARLRGGAA
ncbi:RNA polymerase sigma factor [Myceligenerans halotolerans]